MSLKIVRGTDCSQMLIFNILFLTSTTKSYDETRWLMTVKLYCCEYMIKLKILMEKNDPDDYDEVYVLNTLHRYKEADMYLSVTDFEVHGRINYASNQA